MNIANETPDIIIIGAGLSGIGMAIQLKLAGRTDFVILERATHLGGTWRDNTYPGCACDIPSHLYSYSFAPNPHWSRRFSPQPEILAYIENCVARYELWDHLHFNANVEETRFDANQNTWTVALKEGKTLQSRIVIAGLGPLNTPHIPDLPGLESFSGEIIHSAQWPQGVDLRGKRVAVVGTGASAIQIVPAIVEQVEELYLFQRTPPWVIPRGDRSYYKWEKWLFRHVPAYQRLYRHGWYWYFEILGRGLFGERFFERVTRFVAESHLKKQVPDPALLSLVKPNFQPGCKRLLVSDEYYPALAQDHVEVIPGGATALTEQGLIGTDGVVREVEVIIFATGFHVAENGVEMEVKGEQARDLQSEWRQKGMEAYYGIATEGYPNFFFLLGPNSGLGHNSMIHIMESQYTYLLDYLDHLDRLKLPYLSLKPEAQRAFNAELVRRFPQTVWAKGGCSSWYLDSHGRNTTLWVGRNVEYRRRMKRVEMADFERGK